MVQALPCVCFRDAAARQAQRLRPSRNRVRWNLCLEMRRHGDNSPACLLRTLQERARCSARRQHRRISGNGQRRGHIDPRGHCVRVAGMLPGPSTAPSRTVVVDSGPPGRWHFRESASVARRMCVRGMPIRGKHGRAFPDTTLLLQSLPTPEWKCSADMGAGSPTHIQVDLAGVAAALADNSPRPTALLRGVRHDNDDPLRFAARLHLASRRRMR